MTVRPHPSRSPTERDTTHITISTMAARDTTGSAPEAFSVTAGRKCVTRNPAASGRTTTFAMDRNIPVASTSMDWPIARRTMSGVTNGAKRVLTAVIPTENGTSPLAKYVMTLLAVPPGQAPTSITPAVRPASRPKAEHRTYAARGIIVNCAAHPTATSLGRTNTALKSAGLIVSPMPNIMAISSQSIHPALIHSPVAGTRNARTAAMRTTAAMKRPTASDTFMRRPGREPYYSCSFRMTTSHSSGSGGPGFNQC